MIQLPPALFLLSLCALPPVPAETLHVAPGGNDSWSGRRPEPLPGKDDGPLATLAGARDAIRKLKAAGGLREPLRVIVHRGTYRFSEPFVLGPEDSGTREAPITYAGEAGSRPVLSGGRPITGWRREGRLWVAEVPEVKKGGSGFGALWVNGERRTRARMPNQGYFFTTGKAAPVRDAATGKEVSRERTAFRFQPGDIKAWPDQAGAEVVVYHSWETSIHHLAAIEPETSTVVFTGPAVFPFEKWGSRQRYQVENVREALDEPGEWLLDQKSGLLSYLPLEGEDLARAEVVAPVARQLLVLAGAPAEGRFVEHVHFEELRFLHSEWSAPPEGHSDSQAASSIPGAVQGVGARDCSLVRCEVGHVGTYGVWLRAGSQRNRVAECEIHDLGAGGVRLGEVRDPPGEAEAASHNVIDNNFIHDGGKLLAGGVGVWIGRSSHNRVTHNEVCDFNYTGISVGWSWGYAPSSAHDNLLEANHLHHLGRGVLNDLGAIYTLGISPGTVERSNLMHDIRCYNFGGWGVYTDEGSTGILIEKNIVYNTSSGCFHQHYGKENVLRNNVFAFGEEGVLRRSREEDHTSFIFERNIVLSRGSPFHIVAWTNGRYQIDSNLYWDYGEKEPKFSGMSIAEWQAKGRDRKSILADPLCADPAGFDFSLKEGSPAASIGFEPIDTSRIGLYGSREWVEAPRKFQRTARQAVPPATPEPVEAARGAEKRLVEFGWDEPDTAFLRRHIDEMEKTPFDGCVFHVNYQKPGGGSGSFTWESWSKRAFSEAELQAALEDLRGTKFRRFTHNFLRFNTTPADLDWFDDFSAVAANARLAAGLAREGKARGLLFDIEQYNGQLFDYRRQRDVKTRTWEAYAAQARRRGREVMEAFQAGFPDLVAFLTFGYSLPWSQSQGGKKPLAECSYGLLAPFLDGMLEAARGKARIVDGHELSYGYRDPAQFEAARRRMRDELLPIVADPQAYRRVFSLSFGIWMDHDWRKNGWDTGEPQRNYFPPEAFGAAVQKALQTADEYVWIYSETPRWWSPEGTPVKLPPAYTEALRSARKGLAPDS